MARTTHIEVNPCSPYIRLACNKQYEPELDVFIFINRILCEEYLITRITCERCLELLPLYEVRSLNE